MGSKPLSALAVAAHPDDEVVGAAIWLHHHRHVDVHILHVTDGSPRDMQNARDLGFSTRDEYAKARRDELRAALALVGIPDQRCLSFAFPDKEAYLHLPALIDQIGTIVDSLNPELVFSPAYEGGHPDHDAAAFAVAAVKNRRSWFAHREYPLYHAGGDGGMVTGTFIGRSSSEEEVIALTQTDCALKRRMIDCFRTQQKILSYFSLDCERFRDAPAYDFSEAPHSGPLLYELWGWGISGRQWRHEAKRACVARCASD
jgi:N-acetylglucosamine malate deacetylase 2